ncbi:hypothetical protein PDENDC454_17093 [Paenibacillus dendritiformis C454]|uniref:Uncharacterized protein n=2 Tax=Paenibacillus dendritiformis TaxID=130049 RepID=H3SIP5_9BACL|nr:hypothetical protein PDENDC454_17093 [Paenibacillus dendritiformis C454]
MKFAIDSLIQNGERVSYRSISAKSKELDIDGKGIRPNTVKSNPELHSYDLLHFNSKSPLKKKAKIELKRTRKYRNYSKSELIEMLIHAEQYIAKNNQEWLIKQFESSININ